MALAVGTMPLTCSETKRKNGFRSEQPCKQKRKTVNSKPTRKKPHGKSLRKELRKKKKIHDNDILSNISQRNEKSADLKSTQSLSLCEEDSVKFMDYCMNDTNTHYSLFLKKNNNVKWFAVLIINTEQQTRPVIKKTQDPCKLIRDMNMLDDKKEKTKNSYQANKRQITSNPSVKNIKNNTNDVNISERKQDVYCNECMFEEYLSLFSFMVDLRTEENERKNLHKCISKGGSNINHREEHKGTLDKSHGLAVNETKTTEHVEIKNKWFENKGKYRIGQINGPFDTEEEVTKYIEIWSSGNRGTISKAARGEVLAKQFKRETYGDLSAIFLNDDVDKFINLASR